MTNNKVASYAERIERVMDEIDSLKGELKDLYTEVKSADLKPKVLRTSIARKRKKVDAAFEAEVEEYAALLLALPGATYRDVAAQTGIPKSTLQRRVPKRANGTETTHDPETGEIQEVAHSGDDAGHRSEPSSPAEQSVNAGPPPAHAGHVICSQGEQSGIHSETARAVASGDGEVRAVNEAASGLPVANSDGMDIPAHLDRRAQVNA